VRTGSNTVLRLGGRNPLFALPFLLLVVFEGAGWLLGSMQCRHDKPISKRLLQIGVQEEKGREERRGDKAVGGILQTRTLKDEK
jgi:hypothetical protein